MTYAEYYDKPLTEDEEELVTIINGLEAQATHLHGRLKEIKDAGILCGVGAGAALVSLAPFLLEPNSGSYGLEIKSGLISVAAAMGLGGITQFVRKQRMEADLDQKIDTADELRRELDPAGLGLFEDSLICYVPENETDTEEDSFFED